MKNIENTDLKTKTEIISSKKINKLSPTTDNDEGINIAYAQNGYSEISDFLTFDETDREIAYPTANALGCSFDPDLAREVAKAVGEDLRDHNINIAIISGTHPKRDPKLCKNAYYYSEDTYHAMRLCEGFAYGLRTRGVGVILDGIDFDDHAVSPERYNNIIDMRLVNEIYENSLELFIRKLRPLGIIAPAGMINGVRMAESEISTENFRKKTGFGGIFLSPNMAGIDPVKAVNAGVLPEMTNDPSKTYEKVLTAAENGEIPEEKINSVVMRLSGVARSIKAVSGKEYLHDKEVNYTSAKNAARECFVLLKNDGILPLEKGGKLCVIGKNAVEPFVQIRGRYWVNAVDKSFMDVVSERNMGTYLGDFANTDIHSDNIKDSGDTFILFMGMDRTSQHEFTESISVPEEQVAFLKNLKELGKRIICVITSAVIPVIDFSGYADAVIYDPLCGEGAGEALYEILSGMVSPSGRMNQSVPYKMEDYPAYKYSTGNINTRYAESVLSGYRYFTLDGKKAAYPFGHGLTYTTFEYSSPVCSYMKTDGNVDVSFDVTNTGERSGKEVVQVYVRDIDKRIFRPGRELRYFEKLSLQPGETKTVKVRLNIKDFSFFDLEKGEFNIASGKYAIDIAASSEDVRITVPITILSDEKYTETFGRKNLPSYYPENSRRLTIANSEFKMLCGKINEIDNSNDIASMTVKEASQADGRFRDILEELYIKLKFIPPKKSKEPFVPAKDMDMKKIIIENMSVSSFGRYYSHLLNKPKKMSDVLGVVFGG